MSATLAAILAVIGIGAIVVLFALFFHSNIDIFLFMGIVLLMAVGFYLCIVFGAEVCPDCQILGWDIYCTECGHKMPSPEDDLWDCPSCPREDNKSEFCGYCGTARPVPIEGDMTSTDTSPEPATAEDGGDIE